MTNCQEARNKLTNTKLNKLNSTPENKTGTKLRLNKKKFEDEELPHELFLTTRQKSKTRNAFANKMLTDIKLSNQVKYLIRLIFWFLVSQFRFKKALINVAIPLARDNLHGLVSNLTSNPIKKFERKIREKELSEQEKDLLCLFRMKK